MPSKFDPEDQQPFVFHFAMAAFVVTLAKFVAEQPEDLFSLAVVRVAVVVAARVPVVVRAAVGRAAAAPVAAAPVVAAPVVAVAEQTAVVRLPAEAMFAEKQPSPALVERERSDDILAPPTFWKLEADSAPH